MGSIISAHYLFSINKPLFKNAVVIADSVSVGRHGEGGHGVQEAGGKAAETAVAQTGVLLHVLQLLDVKSHLDTGAKDGGGWSEVRYTAHGLCKVIIVGVVSAVVVVVGGRGSGGLEEDGEEAGEQKKKHQLLWSRNDLLAVSDPLGKDAIVIADAIAVGSHAQGGHGVQETRGEATQATVSQTSIFFHIF